MACSTCKHTDKGETDYPCCDCKCSAVEGTDEFERRPFLYESIYDTECKIKDSGNRREFDSGAVRDIQEGKGRCDLLPLDSVSKIYLRAGGKDMSNIIHYIREYQTTGVVGHLERALIEFIREYNNDDFHSMFLEVSIHFEEGAKKYGVDNWRKGIPTYCYIDSALRHFFKYLRGDTDEPHKRAFVWNILACIWTSDNKPELNTYAKKEASESD